MSLNKGGDSRFLTLCIPNYPKIAAAEAACLLRMQDASLYQSDGIFLDAWKYRSDVFARISSFTKYLPIGSQRTEEIKHFEKVILETKDLSKIPKRAYS
ncbi:hypothetical protein [Chlamydiifrater volucris]|uniref:hypothetical protein n=1 Tax=Chlamydiifrater volucris TaxID=2681470 RepID=UPI0032B140B4